VQIFLRKGEGRRANYYAYIESGLRFTVTGADGENRTAMAPAPEDGWHHLAFTCDAERLRIVVDGEVTGEAEMGGVAPQVDDSPLYIGTHSPGYKWSLAGTLDELCISDEALTPEALPAELEAARALSPAEVQVKSFEPEQGALVLARDGVSGATIVVAAGASQLALQPARELHEYLRRITGAWVPIREDSEQIEGNLVLVGESRYTRQAGIDTSALDGDSYIIRTAPGRLVLVGRDRVLGDDEANAPDPYRSTDGTANAVYAFLHDQCGVRWLMPGRLGEVVPHTANLEAPALDVVGRPWRAYSLGSLSRQGTWGQHHMLGSSMLIFHRGGHLWYTLIPTETYFADHPDWFALHNGQRDGEGNNLCTTNEQMRAEALKNLRALFDEGYDWIELGQSDGYRRCECAACEAQDQYRESVGYFVPGVPADRIHLFHSWLAEQIAQSHPGRKLIVIAYGPSAEVPKAIDHYPDNVIIEFTHDPDELLQRWGTYHDSFVSYVYWFGGHRMMAYGPKMSPEAVAADLRRHVAAGAQGYYFCGGGDCWGLDAPAYYVAASLMRDPQADVGALLGEFRQGLFGPGADAMADYFAALDEATGEYHDRFGRIEVIPGQPYRGWSATPKEVYPACFTPERLARMADALDRATAAASNDDERRRVAFFRDGFDFVRLTTEAFVALAGWEQAKDDASLTALRAVVTGREALADEMLARQAAAGDSLPPVITTQREYLLHGPYRRYDALYAPLGEQ
ncbi:MAG TPA: DUF4838 domain-containing protein, partial [Armatimonadota bacterium]|nr:DUF4838 domain-containing protein [Armatimonadota bacterium]